MDARLNTIPSIAGCQADCRRSTMSVATTATITPAARVQGRLRQRQVVPIASATARVVEALETSNYAPGADCQSTLTCRAGSRSGYARATRSLLKDEVSATCVRLPRSRRQLRHDDACWRGFLHQPFTATMIGDESCRDAPRRVGTAGTDGRPHRRGGRASPHRARRRRCIPSTTPSVPGTGQEVISPDCTPTAPRRSGAS
jgi:hypothetical protein